MVSQPSSRSAPIMVRFFPRFMGFGSMCSCPRGTHTCDRLIRKLAPDSSTNTSLSGSTSVRQQRNAHRLARTSDLSCSAGLGRFFLTRSPRGEGLDRYSSDAHGTAEGPVGCTRPPTRPKSNRGALSRSPIRAGDLLEKSSRRFWVTARRSLSHVSEQPSVPASAQQSRTDPRSRHTCLLHSRTPGRRALVVRLGTGSAYVSMCRLCPPGK
jgi:hypothetical protein